MATPSAAVVFQGRDNTGAAAIVDSTQDTSFMDNMLDGIAKDAMAKRKEQQQAKEDLRKDMEALQYDPLGQEPLDLEGEELVKAAEDYAIEAFKKNKDPLDMTTDEGREFLKLKRKAQMNAIRGKGAVNYYNLAMKGAGSDDVDQKRLNAWMKGYQDVKPKDGETLAMALNRYVEQNPYAPMKPVGAYDFVTPLLPNISREKKGLVSELNKDKVMGILRKQLISQEGQNIAARMMEEAKLDFNNPDDVNKFLEEQYVLIEGKLPRQQNQGKSSSGSGSRSGSGNKSDYVYEVTRSDNSEMWKADDPSVNNGILLRNKTGGELPLQEIKTPDNGVVQGTPLSITRNKAGDLYLEYSYMDGKYLEKGYVSYDMFRDNIIAMYGKDISQELLKENTKSEKAEKPKGEGAKKSSGETKEEKIKRIMAEAAGKK
jgi:hypothetical protein